MPSRAALFSLKGLMVRTSLIFGVVFVYFLAIVPSVEAAVCPFGSALISSTAIPPAADAYDCTFATTGIDTYVVPNGVTVTLQGNPTAGQWAELHFTNFEIQAGGAVTAYREGWQGIANGTGPGPGGGLCVYPACGGGAYGGNGGHSSTGASGGTAYGSVTAPLMFGSAGGGTGTGAGPRGGDGGGIVHIMVQDTFINEGTVSAAGEAGLYSAGGAGGSIFITAYRQMGTGYFSVRGGNGRMSGIGTNSNGGGAGGRIHLDAETFVANYTYNLVGGTRGGSIGGGNGQPGTLLHPPTISSTAMDPTGGSAWTVEDISFGFEAYDNTNDIVALRVLAGTDVSTLTTVFEQTYAGGVSVASESANLGTFAEGDWIFRFEAENLAGEISSIHEFMTVVQNDPPSIDDISITPSAPTPFDIINIAVDVSDDIGLEGVKIFLDGEDGIHEVRNCAYTGQTSVTCAVDIGPLKAFQHTIHVEAVDGLNVSTGTELFFVDGGLHQESYRWRNDDGDEASATWAAGADTILENVIANVGKRLRIGVSDTFLEFNRESTVTGYPASNHKDATLDLSGNAYFPNHAAAPGSVIKVSLDPFEYVSTATLATGENNAVAVAYNSGDGYLYVGTDTDPGIIVRVDAETMTRVDALALPTDAGNGYPRLIMADPSRNAVYVATHDTTEPANCKLFEIDTSTFTITDFVGLPGSTWSGVMDYDDGYIYIGKFESPASVVKIDVDTMSIVDTLPLIDGVEEYPYPMRIDEENDILYVATATTPSYLVKIDLATFTHLGSLNVGGTHEVARTMTLDVDNQLAYLGYNGIPATAVQVDLETMSVVTDYTAPVGDSRFRSSVPDDSGRYVLMGLASDDGIVRFDVADRREYQLEYGLTDSDCSLAAGWTPVLSPAGTTNEHWKLYNSSHVTDLDSTTDSLSLSHNNPVFWPGLVMDETPLSPALPLGPRTYTELEYSITPTSQADPSQLYCFRLTDAGDSTDFIYETYAEATVVLPSSPSPTVTCNETNGITLNSPNGGELLNPGSTYTVLWGATGCDVTAVKLSLSTDSGATYGSVITTGADPAGGYYNWSVPSGVDSASVRMLAELLEGADVVSSDASDADFTVGTPTAEAVEECTEDEWQCDEWGECVDGEQTRVCSLVLDCETAESAVPPQAQQCVTLPVCAQSDWACMEWGECQTTGIQERTCELSIECEGGEAVKPEEFKQCEYVEPTVEPEPEPEVQPEPEPVPPPTQPEPEPYTPPQQPSEPTGDTSTPTDQNGDTGEPTAPPAPGSDDDSIYSRLMRNQQLTSSEVIAASQNLGQALNESVRNMSEEQLTRYAEVNIRVDECENIGIVVFEDCEEYLSGQNNGVFPGCEELTAEQCAQFKRAALIGYMPADVLADVDEVVNAMGAGGEIQAIAGITAINPDSDAMQNVQMVQSIQAEGTQTSPYVMFIAPSAQQKLENWTPPTQLGQPRGSGEVDEGFSAQAVLEGEEGAGGLQFTGICDPDMVCYLYLYSYVPVVTAIKTNEDGEYVADLGDSVADGRHIAQVVTTDQEGNVTKKSEPEPFYVREGGAVEEELYLGEGLYEGLTDEVIPIDNFLTNMRQYALILVLMFVFIVGMGWASVARKRKQS